MSLPSPHPHLVQLVLRLQKFLIEQNFQVFKIIIAIYSTHKVNDILMYKKFLYGHKYFSFEFYTNIQVVIYFAAITTL